MPTDDPAAPLPAADSDAPTNKALARVLKETANLIELTGGNRFRARAFSSAARTVERLEAPLADLLASGKATEVKGIGAGLEAQLRQLVATGSFELRDQLLESLPPGILDVLAVRGLGVKKVRALWQERGITSLGALEAAAQSGALQGLAGFGPKVQANIVEGVRALRTYRQARHLAAASAEVAPVVEALREAGYRAEVAGEIRRSMNTVRAAHLVASRGGSTLDDLRAALSEHASEHVGDAEESQPGDAIEGTLPDGLPLRIELAQDEGFGTALLLATGSEDFLAALRERCGEPPKAAREDDVFAAMGLAPIPPELREDADALEAAESGTLPDLVTTGDLRGSLHNHSTYSDGAHSLRQMAEACRERGLSYFGICDHSQSLGVANGLSPGRVAEQQEEIAALNEEFAEQHDAGDAPPFRIFSGIESDILSDGSLDYDDDVLASFDFVVASVHQKLRMSEREATERVIAAVAHPATTILGHPTGRLLLRREGYPLDFDAVLDACARYHVAVELNAHPYRLDLDWRHVRAATERGIMISINPDAHAIRQLDLVQWGVASARKGWLTAAQCLNALSLDDFTTYLDRRAELREAAR
jgi:DNA polymerase (family 10)